jgi:exodeoxyribonuclease VII large subunit
MWIGYTRKMPADQEPARLSRHSAPEILSVSALTRNIRDLLEHRYPLLWVAGEISNFIVAKSGHAYFILKDESAQVRCVMFRYQQLRLGWQPRDGAQVEARVLVTLYEARGDFQLNVESMRRAGTGALYEAFLRLRDALQREGLFDPAAKRQLPAFPRTVGVITSRDAAALRDVLKTLERRDKSILVILYPVPVQGEGAPEKIAATLQSAGRRRECDVLLVVRGGGGIEDLWAFNQEVVARAIRASPIPVVTGIGHETDFTIADFAADQRAATPTAAAELVSPERAQLMLRILQLVERLQLCVWRNLDNRVQLVDYLARRLLHPGSRLGAQSEIVRQLLQRLRQAMSRNASDQQGRLVGLVRRSQALLPRTGELSTKIELWAARLRGAAGSALDRASARCAGLSSSLAHLDPNAVLERGFSLVRDTSGHIIRSSASLTPGDRVEIAFAEGSAGARIERLKQGNS